MSGKSMQALKDPCGIGQVVGHSPVEAETVVAVIRIANDAHGEADGHLIKDTLTKSTL